MDEKRLERNRYLADLNAQMLSKHITQAALGRKTGYTQSQISLWLGGNVNMGLDTLIRISKAIENWGYTDQAEGSESCLEEPGVEYGSRSDDATFGYLIKRELKANGLTQKELADLVGTSQSRISEYIRGAVVPSLGVAARICKQLKLDREEFLDVCGKL